MVKTNPSGLLTLYLRREPSADNPNRWDVVAYRDKEATQDAASWGWYLSNRPRRNARKVMFNCCTWAVVWLPDAPGVAARR